MFNRRFLLTGGLALAAGAPTLARAEQGRPMLVFVGHEL